MREQIKQASQAKRRIANQDNQANQSKRWKGYVFKGYGIHTIVSKWSDCDILFDLGFEYVGMSHITA